MAGLCGLGTVPYWHARTLANAILSGKTGSQPVYFEYGDDLGLLRQDGMKITGVKGKVRLFNLSVDPLEQDDLAEVPYYEELVEEMKEEVLGILNASKALGNEIKP